MPIYEYQCEACEAKLGKLQKLKDEPLRDCPECEQPKLKKLVSAAVFRLKGGGWYETDFKTGDKKNVSGGDSGSSRSTDSKKADSGSSKSSGTGDASTTKKGESTKKGSTSESSTASS